MFDFPKSALVDRVVPKAKILANARPSPKQKRLLTDEIQQIRWLAKLSSETVKIPSTPEVPEIQIFKLALKDATVQPELLELLDKAVPQPLFFLLVAENGDQACSAAYKRPSESDHSQWVVGHRFTTDFSPPAGSRPLPEARDLADLYKALFAPLLPLISRQDEPLLALVDRCREYQTLLRRIEQAAHRANREKQFNRRVELNQDLKALKARLDEIEAPTR